MKRIRPMLCLLACAMPCTLHAQESHPHEGTPDNGTDPTRISRAFLVDDEFLDLGNDFSRQTLEISWTEPVGKRSGVSLIAQLARTDVASDHGWGVSDASIRFNHILTVDRRHGVVLRGELYGDTSSRPELGNGGTVFKGTWIYAWFLPNHAIFAPSFAQSQGIGHATGGRTISNLAIDLYYVPKLPAPWYMTVDPALIIDWAAGETSGEVSITIGRAVGHAFGGNAQLYVKPEAFIGQDRNADWGVEVGFKLIGF